jgi:hypothetical protein
MLRPVRTREVTSNPEEGICRQAAPRKCQAINRKEKSIIASSNLDRLPDQTYYHLIRDLNIALEPSFHLQRADRKNGHVFKNPFSKPIAASE